MKRLMQITGMLLIPFMLHAASASYVGPTSEANCGYVGPLTWQTGTQTLGTVDGLTADSAGPTSPLTVYSSTADGSIAINGSDWATVRSATTAGFSPFTSDTVSDGSQSGWGAITTNSMGYLIERSFYYFDTSDIPDSATVTSVTLYLYCAVVDPSNTKIQVFEGTQANPLTTSDIHAFGSAWSDATSLTANQYNSITLNATAISAINKTGVTKICIREYDHDAQGATPTGSSDAGWRMADYSGTSTDPKLVIEYEE